MSTATASRPTAEPVPSLDTRLVELPVEALRPSSTNPRKTFGKESLAELAASLRTAGVLTPLLVRPIAREEAASVTVPAHYEVVDGERRYKAAKLAALVAVPCYVRALTDVEVLEVQLVANKEREDVHPLEEAEGLRRYMRAAQADAETTAAKIGMSKSHVYQRLKLLELIPKAQEAFRASELTAGHAILIARLQPKDQAEALEAAIQTHWVRGTGEGRDVKAAISVRELAAWIAANVHLDLSKAPWDLAADLGPNGPCTTCPRNSDNAPELFPELKRKAGVCTDPAGYQAKLNAFLQSRRALAEQKAAKKAGDTETDGKPGKVVELSLETYRGHGEKGRGLLFGREWQKAGARACPDTVAGLVVEGSEDRSHPYQDVGKLVQACTAKDLRCKVHNPQHAAPYAGSGPGRTQRQKETAARRKQATVNAYRRRLLHLIRDRAEHRTPSGPSLEDLKLIAHRLIREMHVDSSKAVCQVRGLGAVKKGQWGGQEWAKPLHGLVDKGNVDQLTGLLLELALIGATEKPSWGPDRGAELEATAKRYRINVAAVRADVEKGGPGRKLTAKEKRALLKRGKARVDKDKKALAAAAAGLERIGNQLAGKKSPGPVERKLRAKGLTTGKAAKAALKRAGKKAKAKGTNKPKPKAKRRAA